MICNPVIGLALSVICIIILNIIERNDPLAFNCHDCDAVRPLCIVLLRRCHRKIELIERRSRKILTRSSLYVFLYSSLTKKFDLGKPYGLTGNQWTHGSSRVVLMLLLFISNGKRRKRMLLIRSFATPASWTIKLII
jgi:hypothetical protein